MKKNQRQSIIKNRSSIISQVQNQWLVVFPYELEFTKPVDYSTSFYFQKSYQLIGDLKNSFDPCTERTKHIFNQPDYLITFRIFSMNQLSYRWTLYKKYQSGQEEFIEDFPIDFKNYVNEQITIQPNRSSISSERSIIDGTITKQFTAQFKNTAVNLKCMFYVADDLRVIEDAIQELILTMKSTPVKPVTQDDKRVSQEGGSSHANIEVVSKIDSQVQTLLSAAAQPIPQNTVPEEEVIPQDKKISEAVEEVQIVEVQAAPLEEAKVAPTPEEPQVEVQQEISTTNLLKIQSQVPKVIEEPAKSNNEELQIVTEEPEKHTSDINTYTPDFNREQPVQGEIKPQKIENTPQGQVVKDLTVASGFKFDMKKLIIVLLVVAIGMLGAVLLKVGDGKQVEGEVEKKPKRKVKGKGKKK